MSGDMLYQAVLDRMNITWAPDAATDRNVRSAIEEAQDYLIKRSGNPTLKFEGSTRTLLITCAWYITASRLADFAQDYQEELNGLRLAEGFGCGKDQDSV